MNKLIVILLILFSFNISAQEMGEIVCPAKGDTISNGQLLVVFRLNPDLQIKSSSLDLLIDGVTYKHFIKVSGNKISVLLTTPIKKGEQTIKIFGENISEQTFEIEWNFFVGKKKKLKKEKRKTEVRTSLEIKSRLSEVSGEGAALRQEPPATHQLHFRGKINKGDIHIPIKLYVSNHENSVLQPRDRFYIGINNKRAGVFFGDNHPSYHPLILNGTRVRGVEAFYQFRYFRLNLLYGQVNRAIEGLRLYYNSLEEGSSYPPVNLQDITFDSTQLTGYYNNIGIYKRNIMAARLSIGTSNNYNKIHIVVLKSTDDTNSISYGGQASQNFTFGIDYFAKSKDKRLRLNSGVAAGFTTRDIRYGIATEETIKDLYDADIPFETYNIRHLLVYNSTSTLPSKDHLPFFSYYIKPEYRIANQIIAAEIRRIGPDYQSFGNPYLINNRFVATLSDRLHFFKRRLNINIRVKHYNDNLSKNNVLTINTEMLDATINYMIKENIPRFTGGIREYFRSGKPKEKGENIPEYQIANYFAGVLYVTDQFNINSSFDLNYNLNQRNFEKQQEKISSHSLYVSLNQNYSFGLITNLQYNFMLLTNDTSNFSQNNTYVIRIGYRSKSNKLQFTLGAQRINMIETSFYSASERSSINATFRYEIFNGFSLQLEGGQLEYVESGSTDHNYEELYGEIGLRYRFVK